jgi:hypothetical protein
MVRSLAAAIVVAALVWPAAALGGEPEPALRSVVQSSGHIVVVFSLGDLVAPGEIEVATRPDRDVTNSFPTTNVRLRERITTTSDSNAGVVRWRTRGALVPGVYYVVVSGIADSATSCIPHYTRCAEHWSTSFRVRVPRRSA